MYSALNDTAWNVPFESPAAMFERQVREHPDRLAVAGARLSLTYADLNEYANRIAHALLNYGLGREDLIMVLLPRNIMYYAVNLGILKAGAAFLPVSPSYPEERLRTIYEDAGCSGMIITRGLSYEHLDLLIDLNKKPLFLEDLVTSPRADNPVVQILPEDLAYCIYTSGSTGKPKGVMIEQGNLSNFLQPGPKNPELMPFIERCRVMLSTTALTFDASLGEEFIALCSGMTLVQASEAEILSPTLLRRLMDQYHVDAMFPTPSYLRTLLSSPVLWPTLANIRVFDIGAEAFPPDLYEKIRAVCPDAVVTNGYGPTETTICCLSRPVVSGGSVPIGRPGPNTQCFILGEDGSVLPPGEIGELLICGKGVGRGYRNDPEKTAASFCEYNGMWAYRSGDLACLTEEGEIEFHGRKDRQLKLKGLRIEPGEIEAVMARCPIVGLGAVMPVENRYLCYYYTLQEGTAEGEKPEETVRAYAKAHLAHYMVPDYYMQLESMPVNANWKIDRARLPKPEIRRAGGREPETEIQQYILDNVRNICNDQNIGTDTDLTEVGLSSLDWMVVIAVIGEKYGTVMDLADANRCGNVLGLEKFVLEPPAVQAAEEVSDARTTETQEIYHCLQEISGLGETQMAVMMRLDGKISADALTDAIRAAAAGHPGLFARFERQEDGLHILAPESVEEAARNITVEQRTASEDEMEETVGGITGEKLSAEELFRFAVCESEEAKYLIARFQHTIGDGSSVSILLDDILRSIDGRETSREKMNVYQFDQEYDRLRRGADREKLSVYLDRLLDQAVLPDILSEKENAIPDDSFTPWTVPLSAAEGAALCKAMNISETVLFAGITALALSRQTGGGKVPLLLAYNGRTDVRLSHTFGFLVSPVLLCPDTDPELSVAEYFRRTARQYYDGISLPAFPLEELEARFPGWLDHLLVFQGAEEPHTLFGDEVEETWLYAEDEEDQAEDDAEPGPAEAEPASAIRRTAARWAAVQTCYEILVEDSAYTFAMETLNDRFPAKNQQQILDDVNRIARMLLADQNVRLEELLK